MVAIDKNCSKYFAIITILLKKSRIERYVIHHRSILITLKLKHRLAVCLTAKVIWRICDVSLLVTYTGRLLATPNPISLTDSGDGAYQQVGGMAVEPDLCPAEGNKYI